MSRSTVPAALVLLALTFAPARGASALDHLRAAPKPVFKAGHTLPALTRWGWRMPFDVQVELCERWGYALEFGEANAGSIKRLADENSTEAKLAALAAGDPKRYPLSVLAHRPYYRKEFKEACPPETWSVDPESGKKVWSPEAPNSVFERGAALSAKYLKELREHAPLAIVLNGGEYALSVYGHHGKIWTQDERVVKAKGERSWFEYVSQAKARQETIVTEALRQAVPDRDLYIYYFADGCSHRNRYGGWDRWAWDYRWMRQVTDLPSSSVYYKHFNSGWTGKNDMLTMALNSVGRHIGFDENESYNWMNAGWTRKKMGEAAFGDIERYLGYLKCYYTAGMIGGVAGYFAYPKGGFGADDVGDEPPHWLRQMTALARVHALFSHLEDYIRKGKLLPGPNKHVWSKDQPACELPTGDKTARVVARKHTERDEWLITAWAAGGDARQVTVTLPTIGKLTLQARPAGSVYVYGATRTASGKPRLILVDKEPLRPTAGMKP